MRERGMTSALTELSLRTRSLSNQTSAHFNRVLSVLIAPATLCFPVEAGTKPKVLSVVMHSDLRVIDPIYTTAYITRDHGYMVYDTLLATDSHLQIRPQMADWHGPEADGLYGEPGSDGCKDHHVEAKGVLCLRAGVDRQTLVAARIHDAETAGRNPSGQVDPEADRLGSVQFV